MPLLYSILICTVLERKNTHCILVLCCFSFVIILSNTVFFISLNFFFVKDHNLLAFLVSVFFRIELKCSVLFLSCPILLLDVNSIFVYLLS